MNRKQWFHFWAVMVAAIRLIKAESVEESSKAVEHLSTRVKELAPKE